jgi:hypothetical protein
MLKQYFERDSSTTHVVSLVTPVPLDIHSDDGIDRDTKNSESSESGSTRLLFSMKSLSNKYLISFRKYSCFTGFVRYGCCFIGVASPTSTS